jgi:hypothetical protein
MARRIDREEEVDRTSSGILLECGVESLVAEDSGRPDLMLERFLDVVLGVGLDDKEPGLMISMDSIQKEE